MKEAAIKYQYGTASWLIRILGHGVFIGERGSKPLSSTGHKHIFFLNDNLFLQKSAIL